MNMRSKLGRSITIMAVAAVVLGLLDVRTGLLRKHSGCSITANSQEEAALFKDAGTVPLDVKTDDGLVMTLNETGQVTGLSADGSELLSTGKVGGFLLGEYQLKPGPELVENGGFEEPGGFQMSGGWHRDTTVARSGKVSLRLDVPEKGELLIHVPLRPNAVYMVTFYMKSEELDGTPILHIRRQDVQRRYIGRQANIEYMGIYYPDWVRCQHTFQTLPGAVSGELMFHVVYGKLQGKVWIDDLNIRELPLPQPVAFQGKVIPGQGGAQFQGEWNGIQLEATVRGLSNYIAIEGALRDTTGKDRCVQLTYRLPVAAGGWRWYTGLDSFQTIEPGRTYTNATEIGRDTNRYISPWPYSSINGPKVGLSLAVPMDHPAVYRMWYEEESYYTIRLDFGLTSDTKKFPSQAKFALVLSRHHPSRGMRAAAKKYFTMFPQFFEARTRPGATAQTALIAEIRGLEDFGAMYGDRHGGDFRWIKSANDAGMYAMTYNEPWMWRSGFGQVAQTALPLAKDIIERERRDIDVWNKNDSHDYWQAPRAYSVRAFLNSVFHDEFGQSVMNGTRTYGSGRVVEWLTNSDPEIAGSYGEPIFKKYIPVLRALAQAGWEPVTYATAEPKGTIIERFGGEAGRPLFFTVRNTEQSPQTISVTIDARALGLSVNRLRVSDVLAGKEIVPAKSDEIGALSPLIKGVRGLSFSLRIPAHTTVVLRVK